MFGTLAALFTNIGRHPVGSVRSQLSAKSPGGVAFCCGNLWLLHHNRSLEALPHAIA